MKSRFFHKHWLTIITSILLMIIGPTSCFVFENCPEVLPYFNIHGLFIYNAEFTRQGLNPWRIIEANGQVKYDNYFMRIGFEKTYFSQIKNEGGQSLFALSCEENGHAGSKIGVDTIYLITLQDYNGKYQKNDTLNRILLTNYWTYYPKDFDSFFPLTKYIQENEDNIQRDEFEIKITEPPLNSGDFDFKLILILKNGERFERVSDKIELTK